MLATLFITSKQVQANAHVFFVGSRFQFTSGVYRIVLSYLFGFVFSIY